MVTGMLEIIGIVITLVALGFILELGVFMFFMWWLGTDDWDDWSEPLDDD